MASRLREILITLRGRNEYRLCHRRVCGLFNLRLGLHVYQPEALKLPRKLRADDAQQSLKERTSV